MPITIGYLIAHYLTFVLFDSQRIVLLVTDPFGLGWDLLGIGEFEPQTGWLPGAIAWSLQIVAVVGGHIVGPGPVTRRHCARPPAPTGPSRQTTPVRSSAGRSHSRC